MISITLKKKIFIPLLFALPIQDNGGTQDFSTFFPTGAGAKYQISFSNMNIADLVISIADVNTNSLNIEYYMSSFQGFQTVEMWQQFEISRKPLSRKIEITKGFILTQEMKRPERIPLEKNSRDGNMFTDLTLKDFILTKEELEKYKIGKETVTVPAGEIEATHYRIIKKRPDPGFLDQ